ncbi:hypothetical protein [Labilibaculum euxinus]|uniref:DUF4595 domain-containing protein n=1 Tax=Labilibaculum euxinus TaxID=2686357 RepID=A0A7M4D913_9BACT|nr:hypothetical protein [Labilibaculum euxinus]MUP39142.1 hypothetical protein [Labilibaculum euxinus]MVB08347.1 hypothetical protein [Labilibaculum euxinus]
MILKIKLIVCSTFILLLFLTTSCDKAPELIKVENIETYRYPDDSNEIENLTEHKKSNKIKTICIFRFSTGYQKMLFEQKIKFNKNGKPILSAHLDLDSSDSSFVYYFYDDQNNRFLDVSIGSNKYDTIYTFRKFDTYSHVQDEINYNIKRKELGYYKNRRITPVTDLEIQIEETEYGNDFTYGKVTPSYQYRTKLKIIDDLDVSSYTNRWVCQDSTYSSSYTDSYRFSGSKLNRKEVKYALKYNDQGDWIEKKGDSYLIEREIDYYREEPDDRKQQFTYSNIIIKKLDSLMITIPKEAWKNHKEKHDAISERRNIIKESRYGKKIELIESDSLAKFTPVLWHVVSQDSGFCAGCDSLCFVVAYNTPLKKEDSNLRCLALYKKFNSKYILQKQSFGAIESFNDYDDDWAFDGYNETDFYVSIQGGAIIIDYSYMRGEASYTYAFQDGNWVLLNYSSNHRTCCEVESYSYDYATKQYSFSVFSTSEETGKDTSYTVLQDRPIILMDSMNVSEYDYNETGLLVK